nr:hypothetical protein [Halalkalicoccus subterraneus]
MPETLEGPLSELATAYDGIGKVEEFRDEFRSYLEEFAGWPTPLYRARNLSERYGAEIYLKRENSLHGEHTRSTTSARAVLSLGNRNRRFW